MSASSVHDVPIFFAFHSKIALRKVFGEIVRWAFWTRISLHSSRDGRRPIFAWNVSRILPKVLLAFEFPSSALTSWPFASSSREQLLGGPSPDVMLSDTKETHVKNGTYRFNRMTVQVIWCYTKNSKTFTTTAQLVGSQRRCHNNSNVDNNLSIMFCHARCKRTFCHVVKLSNQYHAIFVTHV